MQRLATLIRIVQTLACLLVAKTVVIVLASFRDYFPPNFHSDFLWGREAYFFGWYRWAFYVHIISGPVALLFGLVLLSEKLRRKFPARHRQLGRVQVLCVLFLVAPSGLAMAWHAQSGTIAAASFALLSGLTAISALLGWQAAVGRRFAQHRVWMLRCYVLLCSAIVLRIFGGASEVFGMGDTYQIASWASWLLPLLAFEIWHATRPIQYGW